MPGRYVVLYHCHIIFDKQWFGSTKHVFCRDKSMLVVLSRQTRVCRNKSFVSTSILLSRKKTCSVATNMCLLRQKYTKLCLSRQTFVVTKVLSRQTYFFSRDKTFVTTSILLSRQKWYWWQFPPVIVLSLIYSNWIKTTELSKTLT